MNTIRVGLLLALVCGGCVMPVAEEGDVEVALAEAALTGDSNVHAFGHVLANGQPLAARVHNLLQVDRLGVGRYRVLVPYDKMIADDLGNFQVVAIGATPNRCKLESKWNLSGVIDDRRELIQVIVRCHTPVVADLVDEAFVVSYIAKLDGATSPAGYFAGGGAGPDQGADYRFSTGSAPQITRAAAGDYSVTFAGLALNGGTVQVSAIGTTRNHCKVSNWFTLGGATTVRVLCFNNAALSDSLFSLNIDALVTTQFDRGARAWADQPNTAVNVAYTPAPAWSLNTGHTVDHPGVNRAFRTGVGLYRMEHTMVGRDPSGVHVTAYGTGPEYCKLRSNWSVTAAGNVSVFVSCFNAQQQPANSLYVETFQVSAQRAPD